MKNRRTKKRGAAMTEMLIALPVLILIIFGSIEATNLLYLQQALTETAYDGVVRGSRIGATEAEIQANVNALLAARDITATTVEVGNDGTPVENLASGTLFNVFIEIDTSSHLMSPTMFGNFSTVEVRLVGRKQ